jgi:hypothetical protein
MPKNCACVPKDNNCGTYIDEQGNKVVEPVYNGGGGTVAGTVCVVKK